MKKSVRNLLLLLVILNLAFIWGNSLLDGEKSNALSDTVIGLMRNIAGIFISGGSDGAASAGGSGVISFLVRKAAHITEFLILAALLGLLDRNGTRLPQRLLAGLSAALIDETIQLYTGRTSLVTDVWIDFSGFAAGTLMIFLILRGRLRGGTGEK